MKLGFVLSLSLPCTFALASCDKSTQPTTPPPAEAVATQETPADTQEDTGDVPWAQMSFDQRKKFMSKHVFPQMKTSFANYDAQLFKGFKCETCHGDDKTFAMPNEGIYALPANDPITSALEYDEKMTRFMIDDIVPQMAEMLGTTTWSPETPDGVGCFTCHPTE